MIISINGNTITIQLNADEKETFDYMQSVSSVFFHNRVAELFRNRKAQHANDIRNEIVGNLTRAELRQLKQQIDRDK